ncbi:MAG: transferase hexapeptide repeat family protein [Bacteroidetes bacterium]|nr:transferase hexapeptide repeat family protein [Bacteroidota bacterium]MDA1335917.1 transferase hexapeptide repeat family protein [Bacteroidota bacterium]
MIQSFKSMVPVIDESSFIHPLAVVIGHVTIGPNCYIGPGAVLRGDWGKIILHAGCNVQENAVIHMFPQEQVVLNEGAHIGHGAMIHGAWIGEQVMVGINSVVLDEVVIQKESIVGALSLVKAKSHWKPRSLIVGNPATLKGTVSDEMIEHKIEGTRLYQNLPQDMHQFSEEVQPLRDGTTSRPEDFPTFDTWHNRKSNRG